MLRWREIEAGKFREDLFYQLSADVIETPSFASQVQDNPEVLEHGVAPIAGSVATLEQEVLMHEGVQ